MSLGWSERPRAERTAVAGPPREPAETPKPRAWPGESAALQDTLAGPWARAGTCSEVAGVGALASLVPQKPVGGEPASVGSPQTPATG